jgi:hypothetical protein
MSVFSTFFDDPFPFSPLFCVFFSRSFFFSAFCFNLDCATSLSQRGRIEQYAREGKPVPPGWVIDEHGKAATDAAKILDDLTSGKAALAPLGGIGEETAGYKGFGYATVVEVLSSALSSAKFLHALFGKKPDGKQGPVELGHFFFAANIEAFTTLRDFTKTSGDIMREIRSAKLAEGYFPFSLSLMLIFAFISSFSFSLTFLHSVSCTRIYTAGEKEFEAYHKQLAAGGVCFESEIAKNFDKMRAETGLTQYLFPWDPAYVAEMEKQGKKPGESIYTPEMIAKMCIDPAMAVKPGCHGACSCHHRAD